MNLILKIKKHIQYQSLIEPGDRVILGVSGGSDSVALTHIIYALQKDFGLQLHIAHLNHGLRKEANSDQRFVENLARQLNIPCSCQKWKRNKKNLGSLEELAREERIRFFQKLSKQLKTNKILLAHTQDDQAETVIMNILRGAGLQGLRGIRAQSTVNGLLLIRPLLNIRKKELLQFLRTHKYWHREDKTNHQPVFFRNKIRLELLPFLEKKFNPNVQELLTNLGESSATDYDFLKETTQNLFPKYIFHQKPDTRHIPLKKFLKLHLSLQRMLIRRAIESLQKNTNQLTLSHLKEVEGLMTHRPSGAAVHLPNGVTIQKINDKLYLTIRKA